jgi:hypothetical protein
MIHMKKMMKKLIKYMNRLINVWTKNVKNEGKELIKINVKNIEFFFIENDDFKRKLKNIVKNDQKFNNNLVILNVN